MEPDRRFWLFLTLVLCLLAWGNPAVAQVPRFIRSDANTDGVADLSDAVFILTHLFSMGAPPSCEDAADGNDDGAIDVADVIYILEFLFGSGSPPPAPFPGCGVDPTVDGLGCASFPICPPVFVPFELESPPARPPASPSSDPAAACGECGIPDNPLKGVYLHSGEFHLEAEDLVVRGRGLDFRWARKYRSRYGPDTAQGNGWDFSYNISLDVEPTFAVLRDGNSRVDRYLLQSDGSYGKDEFFRSVAVDGQGTPVVTFADGGTWTFHPDSSPHAGKIEAITDRNGNALTFGYDADSRLTTVTDTLGRIIAISYDGNGFIESVTDFTGRSVTYEYYDGVEPGGGFGDLKSVTSPAVVGTPTGNDFPAGKTTTYTYAVGFGDELLNHNLLTVTDPRGQTRLTNFYGPEDRVERQLWGHPDDIIDVVYDPVVPAPDNGFAVVRAIVNDRVGNVGEHFFDDDHRCVRILEFTGRADPDLPTTPGSNRPLNPLRPSDPALFETRLTYNADALVTEWVHPKGTVTLKIHELELDPAAPRRIRGNLRERHRLPGSYTPVGDQPALVELFEYDTGGGCCGTNFVTQHTDPRGNITIHQYDAAGNRILTQRAIPGIVEEWEYNSFGQRTRHVWPDNGSGYLREDHYTYYTSGPQEGYLQSKIIDATTLAHTTTYEYDDRGNLTRLVHPKGTDTLYIYNELDQLVREESREIEAGTGVRHRTDTIYDANDNVIDVIVKHITASCLPATVAEFHTIQEYEILDRLTRIKQVVDANHSADVLYEYDANRNRTLTRYGEAANGNQPTNVLRELYDERDLLFREIRAEGDPLQSTTQHDYDPNGFMTKLTIGLEAPAPRVFCFFYDAYDRVQRKTDPQCNITEYHYDACGNVGGDQLPGVPNPFGVRVRGELVDSPGQVDGCNDCQSPGVVLHEVQYVYDRLDRRIREEVLHFDPVTGAPIGDGVSVKEQIYTDTSKLAATVDDNGGVKTRAFDTLLRLSLEVDSLGNSRAFEYDEHGNIIEVTETDRSDLGNPDQVFVTTYEYDGVDRMIRATDPLGHQEQFGYDSRNNVVHVVDERGNVTCRDYDGLGRLTLTERRLTDTGTGSGTVIGAIITAQAWDDSSRLIGQTDGNGNTTSYGYDALNRRVFTAYQDGTSHACSHDKFDNLALCTDANGSVVLHSYDALDRLSSKAVVPGGGVSTDTTFEIYQYDGFSRLVSAEDDDSTVTRSYDSLGNIIKETLEIDSGGGPTSGSLTRVHDGKGNPVSCTYPGGRTLAREFDALDRPKLIEEGGEVIAGYFYIGRSRVERREYKKPDPIHTVRTGYEYDGKRRMTQVRHVRDPDGSPVVVAQTEHQWDPADNMLVRNHPGYEPLTQWRYDSADRLEKSLRGVGPFDTTYQLDMVGNRLQILGGLAPGLYSLSPAIPPADHQVNQYTSTSFDTRLYDSNGNLVVAGTRSFQYDYRDRLVHYSDSTTGVTAHYRYDCLGRRVEKATSGPAPVTRRFFYDDWRLVEEQDPAGATRMTYVHGGALDELLQMQGLEDPYYFHEDAGRNTIALTDENGMPVERYGYHDYGHPFFMDAAGGARPGSAFENPYLFTGRRFDPESGLFHYRTRYLDPEAGRFITRDGIGTWTDPGNLGNAYTYVGNNPSSRLDPMGEYQEPRWRKCKESARAILEANLEDAENRINLAFEYLQGADRALYTKWFGAETTKRFEKVERKVRKIRDAIANDSIKFHCRKNRGMCRCTSSSTRCTYAWVSPGNSRFKINICPFYFEASDARRAGVVVHEVSHEKTLTDDVKWQGNFPDPAGAQALANARPRKAVRNAYNYGYFAEDF